MPLLVARVHKRRLVQVAKRLLQALDNKAVLQILVRNSRSQHQLAGLLHLQVPQLRDLHNRQHLDPLHESQSHPDTHHDEVLVL